MDNRYPSKKRKKDSGSIEIHMERKDEGEKASEGLSSSDVDELILFIRRILGFITIWLITLRLVELPDDSSFDELNNVL
ncbi:unnamed protein product [Cercopithifilaria johnstoni]|uniref:Uncharacterized protein n=1 Tax=Cercopithifilaria johnstoni TaxID=2874296 RepID=A0A8J2MHY3_9BILA|nr:unnamed protein product [Cercopithifilaria johnstoni]